MCQQAPTPPPPPPKEETGPPSQKRFMPPPVAQQLRLLGLPCLFGLRVQAVVVRAPVANPTDQLVRCPELAHVWHVDVPFQDGIHRVPPVPEGRLVQPPIERPHSREV